MKKDVQHLNMRADDQTKDMERLRFEQSEVYRLFTENDDKIVENYIKQKEKMDGDLAKFKTLIHVFENDINNMKNQNAEH